MPKSGQSQTRGLSEIFRRDGLRPRSILSGIFSLSFRGVNSGGPIGHRRLQAVDDHLGDRHGSRDVFCRKKAGLRRPGGGIVGAVRHALLLSYDGSLPSKRLRRGDGLCVFALNHRRGPARHRRQRQSRRFGFFCRRDALVPCAERRDDRFIVRRLNPHQNTGHAPENPGRFRTRGASYPRYGCGVCDSFYRTIFELACLGRYRSFGKH